MRQAIGDYLLRRLQEAGINHIFGVPGDYNLGLMQQLEDRGQPAWIGNCNELNASYATDAYARINGIGAMIVTHGVGTLSAVNGINEPGCRLTKPDFGSEPLLSNSTAMISRWRLTKARLTKKLFRHSARARNATTELLKVRRLNAELST